ncbi:hypothetical protein LMIY3S_02272 [Labrys miyagiensis]
MYAMHYAITLPADYDMDNIRERIATKGPLLDDLPGLGMKAYLVREKGVVGSAVNQYATFYLWASAQGMGGFLWGGRGFGGIVSSFGRPPVRHWAGAACHLGRQALSAARNATIKEVDIEPDADPAAAVSSALASTVQRAGQPEVCLAAVAVDPQSWKIVTFTLWAGEPSAENEARYEVGHISMPELDAILG